MTDKTDISKEEFCKATHTSANCWLFDHEKEKPFQFYTTIEKSGETIYHAVSEDMHRVFKDMPQYGEVWVARYGESGLYSTWAEYGGENCAEV